VCVIVLGRSCSLSKVGLEAPHRIHDDGGVSRRYFSLGDGDSEMMAAGVLDAQGCVALMSKLKIMHVRRLLKAFSAAFAQENLAFSSAAA
jgi:hypothetical protein